MTMARFPTFRWPEREKARSHLTIRLKIRDTFDGWQPLSERSEPS